jgi:putative ABC transport system substrate-binding protein
MAGVSIQTSSTPTCGERAAVPKHAMRSSRRAIVVSLATLGLQTPRPGLAQTSAMPRVGRVVIGAETDPIPASYLKAFVDGLRDLGWIEGKNVHFDWRFANGDRELLQRMVRDMVGAKIDLIVCGNNVETEAAKAASVSIPIVMQASSNPIERGLIASYAHPGGNITGVCWDQSPEITSKSIGLLKEVLPALVRLGALYDAGYPGLEAYRRANEGGARRLGITMHHADVRVGADFEPACADLVAQDVQAVYVYGSPLTSRHLPLIVRFCASRRLPDTYIFKDAVALGALMSYGVDIKTLFHRSAYYVDRILRGAKPADLPVELPTKYELVLNLRAAKARGLTIPPSLLLRADEVIG